MQDTNNLDDGSFEKVMRIYGIYSDSIEGYNTIIWQFPTAYVTVNAIALNYFNDIPSMLLILSLVDFVVLHHVFKHIHNQGALIAALKSIERDLATYYQPTYIPNFAARGRISGRILKIRSAHLVAFTLLAMNIVLFLYSTYVVASSMSFAFLTNILPYS